MNNIFGSNYEEFGSSNSNLILKTKGKIKIQWGNKFIDLLDNNGNINSGISKVIKEISSVNLISKDGLYYVIDDQSLIALVNGKQIVISSNSENTYVSFVTDLEPSEDEKITALHNIGFYYDNLSEVKSFLKGIIYVEDLKSLYIISDGKITKYLADIENPYPRRFVIYKNSLEEEGALVIKGEGSNNGIKFNSLNIFSEDESSIFESEGKIIFNASQGIRSDRIESIVADSSSGYRLYSINGESTLEVDNLVVRKNNTSNNGSNDNLDILPIEYFKLENILVEITRDNLDLYFLRVKYISNYLVNDILSTFYNLNDELVQVKLKILEKINDLSYRIELVSTTYNLLKIKNKVIGLVDDDLVIGKTGNIYNSKDYGIISKLNLFYSTKFDKEGTGESIFPFYSDSLYTYLSGLSYKNTTTYDKILTPLGVIKSLPFVGSASYVSNDKKIYFYDYYGNQLCYIDATDFIKDGMVSDVRIENRNLIVDFNTDSGIQDITIPLSDIFDPDLWQPKITSTNKLLSDLVDDTNQTHLFVTSTEKSTWNGKLDAISDLSTIRSNAANGNTAYGWGNHANAGYALASALNNYLPLTGGTITTNDLNIETNLVFTKGGTNQNRTFSFKRTRENRNIDIGWDWTNKDGAGLALRSVDVPDQSGFFYIWARDSAGTTCLLEGHPDGTLTWGGNGIIHAGNIGSQSVAYATNAGNIAEEFSDESEISFRPTAGAVDVSSGKAGKGAKLMAVKGNTVVWNQLVESSSSGNSGSLTDDRNYFFPQLWYRTIGATETSRLKNLETHQLSESNFNISSIFTFEGVNNVTGITFKHDGAHRNIYMFSAFGLVVGHKYLVSCFIETCDTSSNSGLKWRNGAVIDLTLIYGSGNEPETAAAFEADYQRWFGKPLTHEEYDAGSLRPVKMTGIKTVGFNAWDEEWEIGTIGPNGQNYPYTTQIRSKNYIKVIGGATYYIKGALQIHQYRADKSYIDNRTFVSNNTIALSSEAAFIRFRSGEGVTTYNHDICINLHHSGAKDGQYEPYWTSMLNVPVTTLKGKLNGEGNSVVVFPDGMKKAGSVYDEIVRRGDKTYGIKRVGSVDLGLFEWSYSSTYRYFTCSFSGIKSGSRWDYGNIACAKYAKYSFGGMQTEFHDKTICSWAGTNDYITITDADYSDAAAFKTVLSGVIFYYELNTYEEYLLDDFELPQEYDVDDYGTEEVQLGINGIAPLLDLKYGINAADTIKNLPHSYVSAIGEQSFTEAQKARARKNIGAVEQNEFDSLSETIAAALVDLNNKVDGVETLLSQI